MVGVLNGLVLQMARGFAIVDSQSFKWLTIENGWGFKYFVMQMVQVLNGFVL